MIRKFYDLDADGTLAANSSPAPTEPTPNAGIDKGEGVEQEAKELSPLSKMSIDDAAFTTATIAIMAATNNNNKNAIDVDAGILAVKKFLSIVAEKQKDKEFWDVVKAGQQEICEHYYVPVGEYNQNGSFICKFCGHEK